MTLVACVDFPLADTDRKTLVTDKSCKLDRLEFVVTTGTYNEVPGSETLSGDNFEFVGSARGWL